MANMSVEFANRFPQVQAGTSSVSGGGVTSEAQVMREMQKEGMAAPGTPRDAAVTFSDMLRNSVEQVNQEQVQADRAIKELVAGKTKNIHETMLAVERADSSLKLMMQVRNKIIDAYKEIMRMQV